MRLTAAALTPASDGVVLFNRLSIYRLPFK
jgi:hypothetical protein